MSSTEPENVKQEIENLRNCIVQYDGNKDEVFRLWSCEHANKLYPEVGNKTYTVPPLFVHKHSSRYEHNVGASIIQQLQKSSPKGEKAHHHVSLALALLSHKYEHNLFIINGLEYDNMLKWIRAHADLAPSLPDEVEKRGDIDIMAVDPKHGLIFIQVKAVGDNPESRTPAAVQEKVILGGKQLRKDENVFRWVMQHSEPAKQCHVTRIVALPNLTRDELKTVWPPENVDSSDNVMDEVLFLCKHDLPAEGLDYPEADMDVQSLKIWWDANVLPVQSPLFTETIKDIVSRYVGMLSAVEVCTGNNVRQEVRTLSDAVDVCGMMFRRLLLNEQQFLILTEPCKRRYLSGPPGSGKTVLLVLKARKHVQAGGHAVIINMYRGATGRAIGHFTKDSAARFRVPHNNGKKVKGRKHRKKKSDDKFAGDDANSNAPDEIEFDVSDRVHVVDVDIGPATFSSDAFLEQILNVLPKNVHSNLLFLVDEIYVEDYWKPVLDVLDQNFPDCSIWCAGLYSSTPSGFVQRDLEHVLRCSPEVQKVLHAVDWNSDRKKCYSLEAGTDGVYTQGLIPLCIRHQTHTQVTVTECVQCAQSLTHVLKQHLGFKPCAAKCARAVTSSDVVILVNIPRSLYEPDERGFLDTTKGDFDIYMRYLSNCPLVTALKEFGVPVHVIQELRCQSLYQQGDFARFIPAVWAFAYQGLENKVVIYVPGDTPWHDDPHPLEIPAPGLCTVPRKTQEVWRPVTLSPVSETSLDNNSFGSHSEAVPVCRTTKSNPSSSSTQALCGVHQGQDKVVPILTGSNVKHPADEMSNLIGELCLSTCVGSGKVIAGNDHDTEIHKSDSLDKSVNRINDFWWVKDDLDRLTKWDKSSLFVAGSRCLSQLIMIIP